MQELRLKHQRELDLFSLKQEYNHVLIHENMYILSNIYEVVETIAIAALYQLVVEMLSDSNAPTKYRGGLQYSVIYDRFIEAIENLIIRISGNNKIHYKVSFIDCDKFWNSVKRIDGNIWIRHRVDNYNEYFISILIQKAEKIELQVFD